MIRFSLFLALFLALASPTCAEITAIGDLLPSDPSIWSNGSGSYIGNTGVGSVLVDNGSVLSSTLARIGYGPESSGTVTIDGADSSWVVARELFVGRAGSGLLTIQNEATVVSERETWVSRHEGSSGSIHFENGSLVTRGLLASPDSLSGSGEIHTNGLVSDLDLVFDASHGLQQTIEFNSTPAQDITLNLNLDGTGPLGTGYSGEGTIIIKEGVEIASSEAFLGFGKDSRGVADIEGPNTLWQTGPLHLGKYGEGVVNVTSGASLYSRSWALIGSRSSASNEPNDSLVSSGYGGEGHAIVSGSGSEWLHLGQFEFTRGSISVLNGGSALLVGSTGALGDDRDATSTSPAGTVLVEGDGSLLRAGFTIIGLAGGGLLDIRAGGRAELTGGDNRIGRSSQSSGNISYGEIKAAGIGTSLQASRLEVDYGAVSISNGAAVDTYSVTVGHRPASEAFVSVSGAGSQWRNSRTLIVGDVGRGTLSITEGGVATSEGDLIIGNETNAVGHLSLDGVGTRLASNGEVLIGIQGEGLLEISGGAQLSSGHSILGAQSGVGEAIVRGKGSSWAINGDLTVGFYDLGSSLHVLDGAVVDVEDSILAETDTYINVRRGVVRSEASLDIKNAQVNIEQGGIVITQQFSAVIGNTGRMNMSSDGMLAIAGDFSESINQLMNFVFEPNNFRYFESDLYAWAPITDADPGVDYTLEYLTTGDLAGYTLLTVHAPGPLPGDANGDGVVDILDLDILSANFGSGLYSQENSITHGDFNGNRYIDIVDLDILSANFGSSAAAAIPEPSTALVMLAAVLALTLRRPSAACHP